jgi:hypothetical protein
MRVRPIDVVLELKPQNTESRNMENAKLQPYYRAACDYVRRATGLDLDGSETSLAFLDHYVHKSREKGAIGEELVDLLGPALGVYFGEVARHRLGGHWEALGDAPANWQIVVDAVSLTFHPVGMAAEALVLDEVEGYDASFQSRPEWMELLGEALAAAPPVEEQYYYSFTGRLETLEKVAELLTEFERRRREQN